MTPRDRAIALVLGVAAAAGFGALVPRSDPVTLSPAEAGAAVDASLATDDDFVGAAACKDCHRSAYERWRASTHGRAGGKPDDVKILAPFDGRPRRFRDAIVTPMRPDGGAYAFELATDDGRRERFEVAAVVGGGHMFGGGTQAFFSRFRDGTLRFLPFDFVRDEATWFCNVRGEGREGLEPIGPGVALGDCADWPPRRVLGESPEHENCQSCHGSQIRLSRDPASRAFRTAAQTFAIDCETCHGPGRNHIRRVADPVARASGDVGMRALASLDKTASVNVCLQCHALKTPLTPGYRSDRPFEDRYSVLFSQLGADEPRHADGRTRTFAYQEGHLWSDCWVNGGMTCTSCHNPHAQTYRDHAGRPLEGRFDDRQCTGCHASKAGDASAHTHHRADSRGSRCVACHMPFLQQPSFGRTLRYARSDHTIAIPRPEEDAAQGLVPACANCHADREPRALRAAIEGWLGGPSKPRARAVDAADRVIAMTDPLETARLVLRADERHTAALFTGLARFGAKFVVPGPRDLPGEIGQRLDALARHPSIDVRGLALAFRHMLETRPDATKAVIDSLAAEGETGARVRARWTAALAFYAEEARGRDALLRAVDLFGKALEVAPERADVWTSLGFVQAAGGQLGDARRSLERAVALDSGQPRAWLHLGEVLRDTHEPKKALEAWARALAIDDGIALAHLYLGEASLETGQNDAAIAHAGRAREADPNLRAAAALEAEARARRDAR